MIKFKEFDVGDADYKVQMEQFQTENQNAEFVQITGGHMGYEKIWFKYDDNINQPQLTISKSIADIIDGYSKYDLTADKLIMMTYRDYQEFHDWLKKEWIKNDNIAKAYLAGKALGVDLVKVVADD